MNVRDLMTPDPKSCSTFTSLNSAAHIMWENDCGFIPVVDNDGSVVGVITDRDVCMAAYLQAVPLTGSLVTSAMSKQVFCCKVDDDVAAAEQIMRDKQVRRLPVVDAQNHLVGIISLNDIAREGEREQSAKAARQVTDAEITRLMAAVCAPRHRIIAVQAA
ncbi:MAG: CBS domain-containing protein [Candidatus Binataceae bacterium]